MRIIFLMLALPSFFAATQLNPFTGDSIRNGVKLAFYKMEENPNNSASKTFSRDFHYFHITSNRPYEIRCDSLGNLIYWETDDTFTNLKYDTTNQLLEKIESSKQQGFMWGEKRFYVKGRIVNTTYYNYIVDPKTKDTAVLKSNEYQYNYKGNKLIGEVHTGGGARREIFYSYNKKGDLLQTKTVMNGNNLIEKKIYSGKNKYVHYNYNVRNELLSIFVITMLNDKILKQINFSADSIKTSESDFVYNQRAQLLQSRVVYKDNPNLEEFECTYMYNNEGLLLEKVAKINGILNYRRVFSYDQKGNILQSVYYDSKVDWMLKHSMEYEYWD